MNIAALRACLSHPVRMEFEQAILRLVIGGIALGYIVSRAHGVSEYDRTVLVGVEGFVVIASAIIVSIFIWPTPSAVRRVAGMVADVAMATLFLFFAGEAGTVITGMYLFVIIGNGFRYGRAYLYCCQALSVVGFSFAAAMAPWWREHLSVASGLLIILIAVPLYVGVLAQRLVDARPKVEQKLNECRAQNVRSNSCAAATN